MLRPATSDQRTTRSRRISILASCPESWGGAEELWFSTALHLLEEGHRVDVLKTRLERRHPRIRELEAHGCLVRNLTGPRAVGKVINDVPPAHVAAAIHLLAAARSLLSRRPDAAIVSQGLNFDGAHLAWLCARLRIPYALVSQKASSLYWPPDSIIPYVRAGHRRAHVSVFVCERNHRLTELQLGEPLPHARFLPNPVLVGAAGALPWPESDSDEVRLAFVGRLHVPEKGLDLLLEALTAERWRGRNAHLDVFGDGLNRQGVERMTAKLGLRNVRLHGQISDIEAVWRRSHALVLPSRAEGSSLALQEAMACGRVPIVTDVGGNAELVEDAATGFVAAAPTVRALDEALERAWQRRREWPEIGARAAERIAALGAERGGADLAELVLEAAGVGRRPLRRRHRAFT
jgi:glycosyltransferase involved in cell wall biosynthesis